MYTIVWNKTPKISALPGATKPNHFDASTGYLALSSRFLYNVLEGDADYPFGPYDGWDFSRCVVVMETWKIRNKYQDKKSKVKALIIYEVAIQELKPHLHEKGIISLIINDYLAYNPQDLAAAQKVLAPLDSRIAKVASSSHYWKGIIDSYEHLKELVLKNRNVYEVTRALYPLRSSNR